MKGKPEAKAEPSGVVEPMKKSAAQTPNEGVVPSVGAAALVGMHGFTQPFQLLKYSAISRCGMVLK